VNDRDAREHIDPEFDQNDYCEVLGGIIQDNLDDEKLVNGRAFSRLCHPKLACSCIVSYLLPS
jgi:hypothetical protein